MYMNNENCSEVITWQLFVSILKIDVKYDSVPLGNFPLEILGVFLQKVAVAVSCYPVYCNNAFISQLFFFFLSPNSIKLHCPVSDNLCCSEVFWLWLKIHDCVPICNHQTWNHTHCVCVQREIACVDPIGQHNCSVYRSMAAPQVRTSSRKSVRQRQWPRGMLQQLDTVQCIQFCSLMKPTPQRRWVWSRRSCVMERWMDGRSPAARVSRW